MENNLILEGLLSMVTELKERQEKQVTPASREETINRLDVIEQRISEMQGKSGIPENMVQEILNQIGSIRKGQSENQKQDLEDIKGLIVTSHRYFKERLKVLFPADDTPAGEITPVSWYGKLIYRVTPYLKPKFFLLSAGFIICIISLILNIRFTERMQRLQDNDIKYRYILMKGKADGSSLDLLETKFSRERDNAFIRSLTNSVKGFEYRSRKQAEALERARLLNEQADVDFVITHPEGYELDPKFVRGAKVEYNQMKAFEGADFIYAKNWACPGVTHPADYGKILSKDMSWTVDAAHMAVTNNAFFMHCLPVRRNMIVTDEVIEAPTSLVIPEAANREISATVVLKRMLEGLE